MNGRHARAVLSSWGKMGWPSELARGCVNVRADSEPEWVIHSHFGDGADDGTATILCGAELAGNILYISG